MVDIKNINFQELKTMFQVKKPWDMVIIFVLNVLIAIPLFIILHQNIIDPDWPIHIDRILLFVTLLAVIQLILRTLRTIIILCIAIYLVVLAYGSTFGNYGFQAVFNDYKSMMYTMLDDPNPQDIIVAKLLPFPNKTKILNAIESIFFASLNDSRNGL